MRLLKEFTEDNFINEFRKAIEMNSNSVISMGGTLKTYEEIVVDYKITLEIMSSLRFISNETFDKCQEIYNINMEKVKENIVAEEPKKKETRRRISEPVKEITKEDIEKLEKLGFELISENIENGARMYHASYDLNLDIFKSYDEEKGIYFSLNREKEEFYKSSGKNMVTKIKKWLEKKYN